MSEMGVGLLTPGDLVWTSLISCTKLPGRGRYRACTPKCTGTPTVSGAMMTATGCMFVDAFPDSGQFQKRRYEICRLNVGRIYRTLFISRSAGQQTSFHHALAGVNQGKDNGRSVSHGLGRLPFRQPQQCPPRPSPLRHSHPALPTPSGRCVNRLQAGLSCIP